MLGAALRLKNRCVGFAKDTGGNIAVITAIAGLPLAVTAGYAVDYNRSLKNRLNMIAALDAAALASVIPDNLNNAQREAFAKKVFGENYFGIVPVTLTVTATRDAVLVEGASDVPTTTSGIIGINEIKVREQSKAVLTKSDIVCVLALDPDGEMAIEFSEQARFNSPACSVQANSVHDNALSSSVKSPPVAKSFCTSGVSSGEFIPLVKNQCSPIADPYAYLSPPNDGPCIDLKKISVKEFDANGVADIYDVIDDGAVLYPGTYCKGLKIEGINVKFMPGNYIILDKKLEFKKGAQAKGTDVTFFFKGEKAALKVDSGAALVIKAPNYGAYRGLVFYQTAIADASNSRNGKKAKKKPKITQSLIGTSGGLSITGTAYFPTQELVIESESGVAAQSPATAFIAYRIKFQGKSTTTINVDHEKGGIPPLLPRSDEGARLVY